MRILEKPLVSKKITQLNDKSIYGFIVAQKANKLEIKKEVEKCYGVTVARVNTMRYAGKRKVRYTKSRIYKGQWPSYKKAIVTLKPGDFIDFYANV
jgi:large subunit ribosomal protein L23